MWFTSATTIKTHLNNLLLLLLLLLLKWSAHCSSPNLVDIYYYYLLFNVVALHSMLIFNIYPSRGEGTLSLELVLGMNI